MSGICETISFVIALTPQQRFRAMKNLGHGNTVFAEPWFITVCLLVVVGLIAFLVAYRNRNEKKDLAKRQKKFLELADIRCLSRDELKLLVEISKRSGLRRLNSIFTVAKGFDTGCATLMQELFTKGQDLVERKEVFSMILSVKQKLGFDTQIKSSVNTSSTKGLSSRQMPVGKKITLCMVDLLGEGDIEAEITDSDDMTFTIRANVNVSTTPGSLWRIRYKMGASTWQFNTVVMHCEDKELVFNHTDRISFINRRRFLRVATDYPALISKFGCMSVTCDNDDDDDCIHPEFIDVKIVELSGPGLKILSPVEIKVSERILVIFRVDEATTIQDIAQVRSCEVGDENIYLVVELVGLNEATITRLIKETNTLAIKGGFDHSMGDDQNTVEIL